MFLGLVQCWSLVILVASWTISHFEIPVPAPIQVNTSTNQTGNHLVFKNFKCTSFTFPDTHVVINDTNFVVDTLSNNVSATCSGQWGQQNQSQPAVWNGDVVLELSGGGSLLGFLERNDTANPCLATNFTMPQCNFGLAITKFQCTCTEWWNPSCTLDACDNLPGIIQLGWGVLDGLLCDVIGDTLGKSFSSRTPLANSTLPKPRAGAPALDDNPYIRMANKIVNILPSLGGVRLALHILTRNAIEFGLNIQEKFSFNWTSTEPSDDPNFHVKSIALQIPTGLKMSLDIVIEYFVCMMKTGECSISGLGLYNLRMHGFNDENLFIEQLGNGLLDIVDFFVLKPQDNETTVNNTFNLTLIPNKEIEGPPSFVYGLIGIVPAFIFLFLTAFSIRYHLRRAHGVEKQEDARRALIFSPTPDSDNRHPSRIVLSYSVWRGILRDVVILLLCNSAMIMFVYANASTAVTVTLADEVRIFAFGLQDSVHDFWNSGLKALAFFIALFSGAYPYFKLAVIVYCSVIYRNTKSRALRIIDSIGRYSFLDSFVMMVLVTTLQVPGIALVHAHPPFYSFILATVLSMIAGNIATHTYDTGLIITIISDDGEENISFEKAASRLGAGGSRLSYNKKSASIISITEEGGDGKINASTKKSAFVVATSSSTSSPPMTVPKHEKNASTDLYGSTSPIISPENNNNNNNNNNNKEKEYNNNSSYSSEEVSSSSSAGTPATQGDGQVNRKFPTNKSASPTDSLISGHTFPAVDKKNNHSNNNVSSDYQQYHTTEIPADPTKIVRHNTGIFKFFIDIPFLEKDWCTKPKIGFFLVIMWAAIWAPIICAWVDAPLQYHFSGFVDFLQGTEQDYSLHRLFFDTPAVLGAIAVITIVVAPMIISIFPHPLLLSYLGPWCSTDVFLLTCLAALLQLHDFIKDQAGPLLGSFINCSATLRSPFYVLIVSAVAQQYYIIKAAMGRDPNTHRTSNGAPADNEKPPWLFAGTENF